jgi:selenocysteine lyase/cysteine desulfurase
MLECQKHEFSLPPGLHYLNCAYMSPLPRRVEAAGLEGIRRKRVPSEISPVDFFAGADRVRALFARMIGAADPARIAIVPAVSYGLAAVARNTPIGRGRNVVVSHEQFPSNVHVWRSACRRSGGELRTIAPPVAGEGRGEAWNGALLEAIDGNTAVVALPHLHWADGTRFDLERIAERAREVGAALVVDGTQSVGALPFELPRIRPDALVCAGYKWLLGPYSLGVAYFGPRYDDGEPLEETWIGRAGSEDFRALVQYRDDYRPGAARYDAGEPSNFALMPMLEAALTMVLEWGVPAIRDYCARLSSPLAERARALGFSVENPAWRGAHLFGLRVPAGADAGAIAHSLQQRRVSISVRGNSLRIAPYVYNDREDVEALLSVLAEHTR